MGIERVDLVGVDQEEPDRGFGRGCEVQSQVRYERLPSDAPDAPFELEDQTVVLTLMEDARLDCTADCRELVIGSCGVLVDLVRWD